MEGDNFEFAAKNDQFLQPESKIYFLKTNITYVVYAQNVILVTFSLVHFIRFFITTRMAVISFSLGLFFPSL